MRADRLRHRVRRVDIGVEFIPQLRREYVAQTAGHRGGAVVERTYGRALGGPVLRPALYAATNSFTLSIAFLLLVASDSQAVRTTLVVSDCCRWDSRTLEVAADSDTDAETDCR